MLSSTALCASVERSVRNLVPRAQLDGFELPPVCFNHYDPRFGRTIPKDQIGTVLAELDPSP